MKTVAMTVLTVFVLISVGHSFPTYTAPGGCAYGGTYGWTDIPILELIDDTGKQLFDGDYGKYDWLFDRTYLEPLGKVLRAFILPDDTYDVSLRCIIDV